jgi:hypothetical protein
MIEETAAAIATGAAGNIIAYMLNNKVDSLREWCGLAFRHGTAQEQSEALGALDQDTTALAEARTTEAEVLSRWITVLISYLEAHPEAAGDVGSLGGGWNGARISVVGSQTNSGSGTFIAGSSYGGIHLSSEREPSHGDN